MKKSLFGYAKTTKALAKNEQHSEIWDIYDDHFTSPSKDEFGNNLLPIKDFDPFESALEIPSPSFPKDHDLIKNARHLISEYDYFFDTSPFKIWISGTNGKTTTTQMTQFLLADNGAQSGGNIGTPLANLDKSANFWVLETSSFTLYYTKKAYPEIYALLPITPDHLTWHKSMQEYIDAKLKPLSMMKSGSIAILPKEYENFKTQADVISYENESDLAKFCEIDINNIKFKPPFLLDSLLALSIEKVVFGNANYEKLNNFKIDLNKLEEIFDKKNRLWVNDSKGTNLAACQEAVKRYKDKKIHLILGGDEKGANLRDLFEILKDYKLEIYAIGQNCEKIMNLSKEFGIPSYKCEFLKDAVKNINNSLKEGEVALLSPACSSLDQFKSYVQRGEEFREEVKKI